jgi:anti-sigma B factor antagonist
MQLGSTHLHRDVGAWIVELRGEHDISTSPGLVEMLSRLDGALPRIVVDLTAATFIDSSVLAVLAQAGKEVGASGGSIAVVAPATGHPRRVLDLVRLERPPLRVVETRAEAIALVTADPVPEPVSHTRETGRLDIMTVPDSDDAPGTDLPQETPPKTPAGKTPLRRPDPDSIPGGDEAAEREKQRAREDVVEGDEGARTDRQGDRSDRMAERGLDSRPSILP